MTPVDKFLRHALPSITALQWVSMRIVRRFFEGGHNVHVIFEISFLRPKECLSFQQGGTKWLIRKSLLSLEQPVRRAGDWFAPSWLTQAAVLWRGQLREMQILPRRKNS